MDSERASSTEKISESSLSESWNVVDAQEVNNGSEGSDGESIEVIDEEAHNTIVNRDSLQADVPESKDPPSSCSSNSESPCDATQSSQEKDFLQNQSTNSQVEVIGSTSTSHHVPPASGINIYVSIAILAVLISFIFSSAAFSLLLIKFGEFTLGQFTYLFPVSSSDKSIYEYQELLEQIKSYKEESQDLKGIVADLNAAVLNLRKELAYKALENKAENNVNQNDEDDLFNQLLNIHKENSQIVKNDFGHASELNETLLSVMNDVLKYLPENEERENSIETLRIFHLFPSYLKVLSTHYSTDENIKQFIDTWKEKLTVVNENLMNDLKEMQLRMIKHTVKQLRKTERCFFKKLCNLRNFKKFECYEVFMYFLKPYETSESISDAENLFGKPCLTEHNEAIGDSYQSCSSKPNQNKKDKPDKEKCTQDGQNANDLENDDEKFVKTKSDEGSSRKSDAKGNRNRGGNSKPRPSPSKKTEHQSMGKDKGTSVEIGVESKEGGGEGTNAFSSFSWSGGRECSSEKSCRESGSEGWWFLRLGSQRSRIRRTEARGDWLFERARSRRRWNRRSPPPPFTRQRFYFNYL